MVLDLSLLFIKILLLVGSKQYYGWFLAMCEQVERMKLFGILLDEVMIIVMRRR